MKVASAFRLQHCETDLQCFFFLLVLSFFAALLVAMDSDSSQSEDFQLDVSELPSSSPEWSPLSVRIPTESESDVSASIASDGHSLLCPILSEAEEESRPEEDVVLHAAGHMSSGKRKSVVAFDSSDSSGDEEVAAAPTRRKASGVRGQKKKRHCIQYQLDWEEKNPAERVAFQVLDRWQGVLQSLL